jgi:hypothetical protein
VFSPGLRSFSPGVLNVSDERMNNKSFHIPYPSTGTALPGKLFDKPIAQPRLKQKPVVPGSIYANENGQEFVEFFIGGVKKYGLVVGEQDRIEFAGAWEKIRESKDGLVWRNIGTGREAMWRKKMV